MPSDDRVDVAHFMPGSEVVLQLGPVCIETAARQAWRRIVEKLTAGKDMTSMRQASLLREFIEATDFARMRSEHQELAGGLHCQVRLYWAPDGGVRWELLLGRGKRRVLLAYHYESLLLAGGDPYQEGRFWFYDSHRGELEVEVLSGLTVFGGVGQRNFREMGRSRLEADGGIGGGFEVGSRLRLLGALSGRVYNAKNDAWDLRGASLLISAEVHLPRRWSMRAGFLGSYDLYPHSAGYFDLAERHDALFKLSASVFAPPLRDQVKLGFTYEFSDRASTASSYAYTDHRLLAKLIWTFTADPWLPAAVSPSDHVALDYGLHGREIADRVQDLLRQDEAMQRSSSCRE